MHISGKHKQTIDLPFHVVTAWLHCVASCCPMSRLRHNEAQIKAGKLMLRCGAETMLLIVHTSLA